jgi:periplasmic protein TonB
VTDLAFGGRGFEPPDFRPAWLRPAAIAIVLSLHAAALGTLPFLARNPPERPLEVIVDVQPEAAEVAAPPPAAPREPQAALPPAPAPPLQDAIAPPPAPAADAVEATPVQPAPPAVEAPPPASLSPAPSPPPEPIVASPPETPPPPPARAELAPARPLPLQVKPPKPQPKATPKPAPGQAKSAQAPKAAPAETPRAAAPAGAPASAAAGAASQSAYVSAMSAAIRSRLFYPPAARARGAKGVVGVAFTIGASGALSSFAITRSSGDEDLDGAARALVQSAHFPPPPGGPVHVSTSFNYVPH